MAKLSANGRTEIARAIKENNNPDSENISYRKRSYALMSDGVVLTKLDVVFKAVGMLDTHRHSYGWKVKGRSKMNKEQFLAALARDGFVEGK